MAEVLYRDESYRIVGACMAVRNEKGHSFTEHVYHECLEIEFGFAGIPFHSRPPITLQYRGQTLVHTFQLDFLCFEKIVVEIKAVESLQAAHRAQALNYLHAANLDLGLLVNFGSFPKLQYERLLHARHRKSASPEPNEPPALY
jgi:GxxExxY protein